MYDAGGTIFILILFLCFGLFAGVILAVFQAISNCLKQQIVSVFICDFFASFLVCFVFLIASLKILWGKIMFCSVIPFVVGVVFVQIFLQNLFVKPIKLVYNKLKIKKNT